MPEKYCFPFHKTALKDLFYLKTEKKLSKNQHPEEIAE